MMEAVRAAIWRMLVWRGPRIHPQTYWNMRNGTYTWASEARADLSDLFSFQWDCTRDMLFKRYLKHFCLFMFCDSAPQSFLSSLPLTALPLPPCPYLFAPLPCPFPDCQFLFANSPSSPLAQSSRAPSCSNFPAISPLISSRPWYDNMRFQPLFYFST